MQPNKPAGATRFRRLLNAGAFGNSRPFLVFIFCILLAGCRNAATPGEFVGSATNEADWPYRYRLSTSAGKWSGTVEYRGSDGWMPWDTMEIVEQDEGEISFRALAGVPGKAFRVGWHLSLGGISEKGFSGRLIGDVFDSRAIDLLFTPSKAQQDGPATGTR
jgi:hypothetical protein